jgi:hypothetical protein
MAISVSLKYSRKECMKTQDASIVLQIRINGFKSKGGSMAALELLSIHNLNIPCYADLVPNNQAMVQPMNLNLQTPKVLDHNTKLSYFQMLGKTIITIGLQLVLWIYNAHGIEQGTLGEVIIQFFD